MGFTSMMFVGVFLPLSLLIYWMFRKRIRIQNVFMVIASLVFYACFDWRYDIILILSVLITYVTALSKKKSIIIAGVTVNVLALAVLKFGGLLSSSIILPVGMSFYVLQAIGYLFDVMRCKEEPEKDVLTLFSFLCFFPVLTAGPILRIGEMRPQIVSNKTLSFDTFQKAVMIFCWGAFLKLVIADRVGIIVNTVFDSYRSYGGEVLIVGAAAYSLQIYADFAGYSYMALALALVFGYKIPENFRQPYFAKTVSDFWHRWHISLSQWLRDYVYIPLGGNRKGKGRKALYIMITFLVSGIWHGAGITFIIWGLLHGAVQAVGVFTQNLRAGARQRLHIGSGKIYRISQSIFVFVFASIAWVFFRAESLLYALSFFKHMFTDHRPWQLMDGTIYSLGVERAHVIFLVLSVIILFCVSILRERGYDVDSLIRQNIVVKCFCFFVIFMTIVLFGCYGTQYDASQFIYAGF